MSLKPDWMRHLDPETPKGFGGMAYCLAQIVKLDRELDALRHSASVFPIGDLNEVRRIKAERRTYVRAIQNYRPTGASIR